MTEALIIPVLILIWIVLRTPDKRKESRYYDV